MSAIRRTVPQPWNAPALCGAVAKTERGAFLPRRCLGAPRGSRSPVADDPGKRAEGHQYYATISA